MVRREIHQQNRLSWNAATQAHNSHKGDQAAFFRAGGSTLYPEERELLGDIAGLSIVHLQCNAGADTLSLTRLGATVTGVDISDTAIEFAHRLSSESGIPATFHRADIYDWLAEAEMSGQRFDVAFCSYGALCWLSDLPAWARGVAAILKPGGRFVTVEFHPVMMMFDDVDWRVRYPYSYFEEGKYLTSETGIGDYVAIEMESAVPGRPIPGVQNFQNPYPVYEFQWSLAEIIQPLLDAGLSLTTFREYPYSIAAIFKEMRQIAPGRWIPPESLPTMPLLYGIVAQKPG